MAAGTYHAFDFAKHPRRHLASVSVPFNGRFKMRTLLPRMPAHWSPRRRALLSGSYRIQGPAPTRCGISDRATFAPARPRLPDRPRRWTAPLPPWTRARNPHAMKLLREASGFDAFRRTVDGNLR